MIVSFHSQKSTMATTSDISKGAFFRYNNELLNVIDYDHITPGKGNAIYSVKCRNVETGKQSEVRFRSGEKVDFIRVEERELQYLYEEGENEWNYYFYYEPQLQLTVYDATLKGSLYSESSPITKDFNVVMLKNIIGASVTHKNITVN